MSVRYAPFARRAGKSGRPLDVSEKPPAHDRSTEAQPKRSERTACLPVTASGIEAVRFRLIDAADTFQIALHGDLSVQAVLFNHIDPVIIEIRQRRTVVHHTTPGVNRRRIGLEHRPVAAVRQIVVLAVKGDLFSFAPAAFAACI